MTKTHPGVDAIALIAVYFKRQDLADQFLSKVSKLAPEYKNHPALDTEFSWLKDPVIQNLMQHESRLTSQAIQLIYSIAGQ